MTNHDVLKAHEVSLYRRATSDGVIDLFFGLYLVCLGVAWIWLAGLSVFAILLPAALVPIAIATRHRFVENRLGYVKWAEPRRKAERRGWTGLLAVGALLFVVATSFFVLGSRSILSTNVLEAIAPAIMGSLLAVLALALAVAMRTPRFFAYGFVLASAGVISAMQDANPGWSILAGGLMVAASGVAMLRRFVREYPAPGGE